MKLSLRLAAVAALVTEGSTLADIGTDHAYLPIDLVLRGVVPHAIAMDVNRGPLMRAQEHIRDMGLEAQIETRLSDGLLLLKPKEVQSITIAGMGGALTMRILREGKQALEGVRELILQPQSEVPQVRAFLEQAGFAIVQEDLVFEDGKYYPMMRALPQDGEPMQEMEKAFGPVLLKNRHPVLHQYLCKRQEELLQIMEALRDGKEEASRIRSEEIKEELQLTREALQLYEGGKSHGGEQSDDCL